MDVSSLASQTAKLIDSLEKTATTPGADFKSSGPSGEPDKTLVQEFEAHMQNKDVNHHELSASTSRHVEGISTEASAKNHNHFATETIQNPNYNDVDHIIHELKGALGSLTDGTITPEELLRVQFITGMYRNQVIGGSKASQSAAQDIDTLLKQQS